MKTKHSQKTEKESASGITALYSRVTREESVKKGLSLPNQRRRFDELAKQNKWETTRIYEEPSGTSGELPPEKRPALSKLLKDAKSGIIDASSLFTVGKQFHLRQVEV